MTNTNKKWQIYPAITEDFKNRFPEINPIILQLLYNRGFKTQKEIDEFLLPDYSQDIHDPFILLDMAKAVDRIYRAIQNKEKILIYGDYDADGITSTALLFKILKKLGNQPDTYLPDRDKEGYSLNKPAIESFIKKRINLLITCDCGTSNEQEIKMAQEAGIDVIVTDHHQEPKILPKAFALINPHLKREKYPFKDLAGVGVAFKLAQALLKDKRCSIVNKEAVEKWLLDFVVLGTTADQMPLIGENRTLCKYGLLVLNKTRNLGLKVLIEKSGLSLGKLNISNIYYQLSPRLNVAGRLTHANQALNLLLSDDSDICYKLASELNGLNKQRQDLVEAIFQSLKAKLTGKINKKILIVFQKDCPIGALGLVASKLVDAYNYPAIVLTNNQGNIKASGRSTGFNLFTGLSKVSNCFANFGGHPRAAGFTLKNSCDFEAFKKRMEGIAAREIKKEDLKPKVKIDSPISLSDINWQLQEELAKFEPYGQGNQKPRFLLSKVDLKNISSVGANGQHQRLTINDNRQLIYFNGSKKTADLKIGDKIDIVFELGVNQWNGEQKLEMKVIDLRKCKN